MMAFTSASNNGLSCKRCKKKLDNGLKCIEHGNYFHLRCAKSVNVMQFNEYTVKCCTNHNGNGKHWSRGQRV